MCSEMIKRKGTIAISSTYCTIWNYILSLRMAQVFVSRYFYNVITPQFSLHIISEERPHHMQLRALLTFQQLICYIFATNMSFYYSDWMAKAPSIAEIYVPYHINVYTNNIYMCTLIHIVCPKSWTHVMFVLFCFFCYYIFLGVFEWNINP